MGPVRRTTGKETSRAWWLRGRLLEIWIRVCSCRWRTMRTRQRARFDSIGSDAGWTSHQKCQGWRVLVTRPQATGPMAPVRGRRHPWNLAREWRSCWLSSRVWASEQKAAAGRRLVGGASSASNPFLLLAPFAPEQTPRQHQNEPLLFSPCPSAFSFPLYSRRLICSRSQPHFPTLRVFTR